jgi:prepilin signal peptidase PulO-like enzyme (type II secretory pathway)
MQNLWQRLVFYLVIPLYLIILFLAACLGLIFALPALIKKTKSLKSELPFGPFLILATLLYAFYFKNLNIFIL